MSFFFRSLRTTSPRLAVHLQPRLGLSPISIPDLQLIRKRTSRAVVNPFVHKASYSTSPSHILQASSSTFGLVIAASLALGATIYYSVTYKFPSQSPDAGITTIAAPRNRPKSETSPGTAETEYTDNMSTELPPGRVGNLTPEQEEKLRQFWAAIFKVYQFDLASFESGNAADGTDAPGDDDDGAGSAALGPTSSVVAGDSKKKDKKKKRSLFKRSKKDGGSKDGSSKDGSPAEEPVAAVTKAVSTVDLAATSEDDKYGQSKLFQEALASQSPESIRDTIWSMVKHDHPDALTLRFLRARKWDVDKALVMLVSTMHWRAQDMHVDDDIMLKGEGGAAEEVANSTDEKAKTVSEDFLAQMRMGKSFLHGSDKQGRPICIVRVRLHHQGDQVEESVERCTVYTIETARMALHPPVDTATVVFDMTGFSLANMDYSPVKFMIKCFEANYPECLGAVLVHKAPWLFQGIWRIIRSWLDPVVASKVHFTNNVKDMEQFISKDQIIKELDGDEDWEYTYLEPEPGENDKMKDTATRDKLLAEREHLYRAFEEATAQWILGTDAEQIKTIREKREGIAKQLREHYWTLDPYIRARSLYDRSGMLRAGGTTDFYPKLKKDETTQTNGDATAQDDVD